MRLTPPCALDHTGRLRIGASIVESCAEGAAMYSRTQNEDGTYNTRCLYCFMTIASAIQSNDELDAAEARHICPEKALSDLLARKKCVYSELPIAKAS